MGYHNKLDSFQSCFIKKTTLFLQLLPLRIGTCSINDHAKSPVHTVNTPLMNVLSTFESLQAKRVCSAAAYTRSVSSF